MEKYISFTVPSDSAISTVGQVLRAQGHLTKKQISRAKFLPDGIQKNGIRCRITEFFQLIKGRGEIQRWKSALIICRYLL